MQPASKSEAAHANYANPSPQSRLVHYFQNYRQQWTLSGVVCLARKSQDTVNTIGAHLDCLFVEDTFFKNDP